MDYYKDRVMKVVVEERDNEGLEAYLNKPILVWCLNYIYTGILVGINDTCIKLKEPRLVYNTGALKESGFATVENLPGEYHYIQISCIESFGDSK